jgi:hypothetical protein
MRPVHLPRQYLLDDRHDSLAGRHARLSRSVWLRIVSPDFFEIVRHLPVRQKTIHISDELLFESYTPIFYKA